MDNYPIQIKAHAKINLHLHIVGKRKDGYHEIETIFQKLELHDTLLLKPASNQLRLVVKGAKLPANQSNLVMKAALAFKEESAFSNGADILLIKKIPVAAGLGGGSSDAAATLRGLSSLWNVNLDEKTIFNLASNLGADVPFFLNEGAAIGTGKGDKIHSIKKLPDMFVLLVKPYMQIKTPWVYKKYETYLTKSNKINNMFSRISKIFSTESFQNLFFNDLEKVVLNEFYQVKRAKMILQDTGAEMIQMSGSGPTVFALYRKKEDLKTAFNKLKKENYLFIKTQFHH